jgi:hypothetical protein
MIVLSLDFSTLSRFQMFSLFAASESVQNTATFGCCRYTELDLTCGRHVKVSDGAPHHVNILFLDFREVCASTKDFLAVEYHPADALEPAPGFSCPVTNLICGYEKGFVLLSRVGRRQ